MNQLLEEKYKELGISEKVYAFGEKIEQELKERFEKIDAKCGIQSDESHCSNAEKPCECRMF